MTFFDFVSNMTGTQFIATCIIIWLVGSAVALIARAWRKP